MKVVVVGGGHNGLVCAAHVAAAGVEVTVLEHAPRAGGAVASHADTLPGFVHDTCSGFFPLTLASPAFDGLGVVERVSWANPPLAMAHPFQDGSALVLARDVERTVAGLEAAAPGAGRAWRAVVAPLLARRDRVPRPRAARRVDPGLSAAARRRRARARPAPRRVRPWAPDARVERHPWPRALPGRARNGVAVGLDHPLRPQPG